MYIQDRLQHSQVNDDSLSFYKAIGVDYLTIYPPPTGAAGGDLGNTLTSTDELTDYFSRMRTLAESHGLRLYNVAMGGPDEITLALPERDRIIDQWRYMIEAMGKVGIPTLGYNFKPIGNFRTTSATGRGGAKYSTFDYDEFMQNVPNHSNKQIGEEQM